MDARFSADEHFQKGQEWLRARQPGAALEHFRVANALQRDNARYRSFYGLCIGLVERRFSKALELCNAAVKDEFFNPDLYLNLARVHMAFGFKAEGMRYLRRALMIDPSSATAQAELARLGERRRPVLGFLPRRHPINRWLGRARQRLGIADGASAAG
ncbi:MAG: tetratricopeptide repeat protein [Deltaproteobacteria bacterium]|nr:tetratricopeptide repeat protein [Deltaproteobacteria bacterium]